MEVHVLQSEGPTAPEVDVREGSAWDDGSLCHLYASQKDARSTELT
jgi:hypothetical protein